MKQPKIRKPLVVLWESDRLIAVEKPARLATIPGRGETDSVFEQLAAQLSLPHKGDADPRLRVVHRLDKETSGVLLFAKDKAAQRHLSHQFQNNLVEKEYLAICVGHPPATEGEIDGALTVNPNSKTRMMISPTHGRPARTDWKLEQSFGRYFLIRAFPKTGKTHQIRVHLKSIGLPLAVDPLYNAPPAPAEGAVYLSDFKRNYRPTAGEDERPLIDRLTLHAEKLRFSNLDDNGVEIVSLPPKDFRATVNQLGKFGAR